MATVRPFKAIRPKNSAYAFQIASPPYDVMSGDEAREMVYGRPLSFLHVDRAEVDLTRRLDPYDARVYEKAFVNFAKMLQEGVLIQDAAPCFYIYKLTMEGRSQFGLVACVSIDEYLNGTIRKHELTLEEKELDRMRHIDVLDANTSPVFLTYKRDDLISALIADWIKTHKSVYDFSFDEDGIVHTVWVIDAPDVIKAIIEAFKDVSVLYIADGHHRNASSAGVAQKRRKQHPAASPDAEFNYYLSVIFPDNELKIFDYNRLIKGLNGIDAESFLTILAHNFEVERFAGNYYPGPSARHSFGMYLAKSWYTLTARKHIIADSDPVKSLDVSLLQTHVISALLGINDPRRDKRINFVGGIRGLNALVRRVDSGEADVAFAMYPTTIDELFRVADQYRIMPPKSTWFEPKLRSGLFIHLLSGETTIADIINRGNIMRAEEERRQQADDAVSAKRFKKIQLSLSDGETKNEAVGETAPAQAAAPAPAAQTAPAAPPAQAAAPAPAAQTAPAAPPAQAIAPAAQAAAPAPAAPAQKLAEQKVVEAARAAKAAREAAEAAKIEAERKAEEAKRAADERLAAEALVKEAERKAQEAALEAQRLAESVGAAKAETPPEAKVETPPQKAETPNKIIDERINLLRQYSKDHSEQ